jgi:putative Mg2+ transporter-C (MgtC) family protein
MPIILSWHTIAWRLLLTVVSAGAIGLNRDERGHSAGLRTNLLVGLAACVAMIDSNGRPANSYVVMDIMRFPLGILSGIGFIGAGAIIRRGEMVAGVTTAATLWFVTVMGLCYGGGQTGLGFAAFALAFVILLAFKKIETAIQQHHSALLKVTVSPNSGETQEKIASLLAGAGLSLNDPFFSYESSPDQRVFGWKLQWKGAHDETNPPAAIQELAARPDVRKVEFTR